MSSRHVLQAHGQGEHGEPGRGGRSQHGRSVRRGRAADDGHVQERGQTLGHDGPPELQRAEFGLDGHQRRPGVGSPPPATGTHRPPVPLQPLDQFQHHVEVVVQLGAVVFALHGRAKARKRATGVIYLYNSLSSAEEYRDGGFFFITFKLYFSRIIKTLSRWYNAPSTYYIFVSTAVNGVPVSARHTAVDGRLSRLQPRDRLSGGRWSSVVPNVPAEKKK